MTLDKLNVIDKNTTLDQLISNYESKLYHTHEYYKQKGIYRLVYSYKILPTKFVYKKHDIVDNNNTNNYKDMTDTLFTNLHIPDNMDYLT